MSTSGTCDTFMTCCVKLQMVLFYLESTPTYLYHSTCGFVKQEALKNCGNTVQEEGLTNEVRHHLLLLHKQRQDKWQCRHAACVHNRARLTTWAYF